MNSLKHSYLFPKSRLVSKPWAISSLFLALFLALIAFAPGSRAVHPAAPDFQAGPSEKRRRPEFVPGDVLVRFKKDRAFEGTTYVAVPDDNVLPHDKGQSVAAPEEQIPVRVDRFEGSEIVDDLRLAHVEATQTMKAIAALKARDDVLYAEPNYIRHLDRTPNDPSFGSLYGMTRSEERRVGKGCGSRGTGSTATRQCR